MAQAEQIADLQSEARELKEFIAKARKRPVNFAIALGQGKGDPAFILHLKKNPKVLRKLAKAETKNAKGAHGEMTVDSQDVVLACQNDPPSVLLKIMKRYFKDRRLPYRPVIKLPDGTILAEDAADRDEGPGTPAKRLASGDVAAREGTSGDLESALLKRQYQIAALLASGPWPPDQKKFLLAVQKKLPEMQQGLGADAERAKVAAALAMIDKRLEGLKPSSGMTLKQAAKIALVWDAVRNHAVSGVNDLGVRLRATRDSEAIEAAEVVDRLAADFPSGLDESLSALQNAIRKADGTADLQRSKAKDNIRLCLEYLATHKELIQICENNLFGAKVSIRKPLKEALTRIHAAMR